MSLILQFLCLSKEDIIAHSWFFLVQNGCWVSTTKSWLTTYVWRNVLIADPFEFWELFLLLNKASYINRKCIFNDKNIHSTKNLGKGIMAYALYLQNICRSSNWCVEKIGITHMVTLLLFSLEYIVFDYSFVFCAT